MKGNENRRMETKMQEMKWVRLDVMLDLRYVLCYFVSWIGIFYPLFSWYWIGRLEDLKLVLFFPHILIKLFII